MPPQTVVPRVPVAWRGASVALLAGLVGCGSPELGTAEAAEAPVVRQVDACRLLTRDEVQAVTGTVVNEPELRSHSDGWSQCVWMRRLGPPLAALFVGYEPLPVTEPMAAEAAGDTEPVGDVGDAALWTPALGDLQVWTSGQRLQIGNPGIDLNEARSLAQLALARLP